MVPSARPMPCGGLALCVQCIIIVAGFQNLTLAENHKLLLPGVQNFCRVINLFRLLPTYICLITFKVEIAESC